ncbi:hypothetical protein IWW55_005078 [Coemansia sp. RSA 2706]|nr:hypothetical protein IWW55_005078 [Coemansia sp. RSA 2706]
MTGPRVSLNIPDNSNPFYAILARSSSPHSPTASESSSAATEASTDDVEAVAGEYVWTPPAPDPRYWEHVAKAQKLRSGVRELRAQLAQGDSWRLGRELRARERRLMRYVDHHVLDYDDVLRADARRKAELARNLELGTISPPISPDLAPDRPLPPLPPGAEKHQAEKAQARKHQADKYQTEKPRADKHQTDRFHAPRPREMAAGPPLYVSGALPPTPAETASGTRLDSQGFINSYKKNARLAEAGGSNPGREKSKGRQLWTGLFGSRIRPVESPQPANRRRSGSVEEAQMARGASRLASMSSVPALAPMRGRGDTAQSVYAL